MSGDARDFNNMDMPAVINFSLQGTLGEHPPSYVTVKNLVAQFKRGDFSTCNEPRTGRHKILTTLEIIDQIHELILEEPGFRQNE